MPAARERLPLTKEDVQKPEMRRKIRKLGLDPKAADEDWEAAWPEYLKNRDSLGLNDCGHQHILPPQRNQKIVQKHSQSS